MRRRGDGSGDGEVERVVGAVITVVGEGFADAIIVCRWGIV